MDYSLKSSKKTNVSEEENSSLGHRKRVREKFMQQDVTLFSNTEIIEALLFFCNSRRDVKLYAKLLDKASKGSFLKFLFLDETDFEEYNIQYIKENLLFINKIIKEIIARQYKDKIEEYTFYNTQDIVNYLGSRAAFLTHEEVRVLFLNAKNKLIKDVVMFKGTVNETPFYPREILNAALKYRSLSIIISHNHPSGDIKASNSDLEMTYELKKALETITATLQDHIIIAGTNYFSFKEAGLI